MPKRPWGIIVPMFLKVKPHARWLVFFFLIIIGLSWSFNQQTSAQTVAGCPPGYSNGGFKDKDGKIFTGDTCCSTDPNIEVPWTKKVRLVFRIFYCIKRVAPNPAVTQLCQQKKPTPTNNNNDTISSGNWCPKSNDPKNNGCGYADNFKNGNLTIDLCLPPTPPPDKEDSFDVIGQIYDTAGKLKNVYCDKITETSGPVGKDADSFYCQPKLEKDASNRITSPPPPGMLTCGSGRKDGTSPLGKKDYSGETWCCPAGQVALNHPKGTNYCAIISPKLEQDEPNVAPNTPHLFNLKFFLQGKAGVEVKYQLTNVENAPTQRIGETLPYEQGQEVKFDPKKDPSEKDPRPISFQGQDFDYTLPAYHKRVFDITWDTRRVPDGTYKVWGEAVGEFGKTDGSKYGPRFPSQSKIIVVKNGKVILMIEEPKEGTIIHDLAITRVRLYDIIKAE